MQPYYPLIALLGLLIGSFLNVCIYRIPRGESIAFPPSHCFSCKNRLKPLDLFPVFSYIFLKGKCRYCGENISIQYPLIETLNSLVYLLLFAHFGMTIHFIFYAVLSSLLIVVSIIDYYHKIIPDKLVLVGLILGILYKLTAHFVLKENIDIVDGLLGFLVGGGIYLLIAIVSNGGMGGGDIKLTSVLGFWIGLEDILISTLLTFIIGAVVSIFLLATKIKGRKDAIPFGPFICIGTFMMILFKEELIDFYMKIMF